MNEWAALSLVFGLYGIAVSLVLFYAQSLQHKRICWYLARYRNHHWILIFNTSRRHLFGDSIYEPISLSGDKFRGCKTLVTYGVKSEDIIKHENEVELCFKYLEPKAYWIVELVSYSNKPNLKLSGILRDGEIAHWPLWFARLTHSQLLEFLAYLVFILLFGGFFISIGVEGVSTKAFNVLFISGMVLAMALVVFLDHYRRISDWTLHRAVEKLENRKKALRKRTNRIVFYRIGRKIEKWVRDTVRVIHTLFHAIQKFFHRIKKRMSALLDTCKSTIKRLFKRLTKQ